MTCVRKSIPIAYVYVCWVYLIYVYISKSIISIINCFQLAGLFLLTYIKRTVERCYVLLCFFLCVLVCFFVMTILSISFTITFLASVIALVPVLTKIVNMSCKSTTSRWYSPKQIKAQHSRMLIAHEILYIITWSLYETYQVRTGSCNFPFIILFPGKPRYRGRIV